MRDTTVDLGPLNPDGSVLMMYDLDSRLAVDLYCTCQVVKKTAEKEKNLK